MTLPLRPIATLCLLAAASGCGSSLPSEPGAEAVPHEVVIDRGPVPMPGDPVNIVDARLAGDELVLALSHGGGCRVHRFALHLVLPVPQTDAPVLDLTLSHDAKGDPCEALLTPELGFDLRTLHPVIAPRRAALLRIYRPGSAAPSFELPYSF